MIVDCFQFIAAQGKEYLKLRYETLKDHVDYFLVMESSVTFSGIEITYEFERIVKEYGFDREKFIYSKIEIPNYQDIDITNLDDLSLNTRSNKWRSCFTYDPDIKLARARKRILADSLLGVIEENDFPEDTVFIVSDGDQLIDPKVINWVASEAKNSQDIIIKIPLTCLQAAANLKVYNKKSKEYVVDFENMFAITKNQLKQVTPTQIKLNYENPFPIQYLTHNNNVIKDMGWHLSWMGNRQRMELKSRFWSCYKDVRESDPKVEYDTDEFRQYLKRTTFKHMSETPCGRDGYILKRTALKNVPPKILEHDDLKNFFIQNYEKDSEIDRLWETGKGPSIINNYQKSIWVVDDFYKDPDEIRHFALSRHFDEGGVGRGYIGKRTSDQYLLPGLKEAFENIMGMKITSWEEQTMNGRFQSCSAGDPIVYHTDAQHYAGMIYLTPDAPFQSGTTMYAHKETRVRHSRDPNLYKVFNANTKTHLDKTPYEPVDVVGNVYNRLLIFDSYTIHAASEYFGYDLEHSRLWQMFFFDAE